MMGMSRFRGTSKDSTWSSAWRSPVSLDSVQRGLSTTAFSAGTLELGEGGSQRAWHPFYRSSPAPPHPSIPRDSAEHLPSAWTTGGGSAAEGPLSPAPQPAGRAFHPLLNTSSPPPLSWLLSHQLPCLLPVCPWASKLFFFFARASAGTQEEGEYMIHVEITSSKTLLLTL